MLSSRFIIALDMHKGAYMLYRDYRVFLSSTFDPDTVENRDMFRFMLTNRFNTLAGGYGTNVYVIDYEFGIPAGTTKVDALFFCLNAIKQSDLFVCIIGNRYGDVITQDDLLQIESQYGHEARGDLEDFMDFAGLDELSVFACEILTALRICKMPAVFLLQDMGGNRDSRLSQLVSIASSEGAVIVPFSDRLDMAEAAMRGFVSAFSSQSMGEDVDDPALNRVIARSLRYEVRRREMSIIQNSLESCRGRPVVVCSADESRNTSLLAALTRDASRARTTVLPWFSAVHQRTATSLSLKLADALGSPRSCIMAYSEDCFRLLSNVLETYRGDPVCIILDCIDELDEAREFSSWVLRPTSSRVSIVASTSDNEIAQSAQRNGCTVVEASASHFGTVVERMFMIEGKQLEYDIWGDQVANELTRSCSCERDIIMSLEAAFTLAKFAAPESLVDTVKRCVDELAIEGHRGLLSMKVGILAERMPGIPFEDVVRYLSLSHGGLSAGELEILTGRGAHLALDCLYYDLNLIGELYMLDGQSAESIAMGIAADQRDGMRNRVLGLFENGDDLRSLVESFSLALVEPGRCEEACSCIATIENFAAVMNHYEPGSWSPNLSRFVDDLDAESKFELRQRWIQGLLDGPESKLADGWREWAQAART